MKQITGLIWEAASKDEGRPVLTHVYFDAEKATLSASNSYILAVVPCEVEEGDESGLIPAAALKAQYRIGVDKSGSRASLVVKDGTATLVQKDKGSVRSADTGRPVVTTIWPLGKGTFPNAESLVPKLNENLVPFGFNPDLLQLAGHAIGAGGKQRGYAPMVCRPDHPLKPMRIDHHLGGYGVVMPVRVEGVEVAEYVPPPDLSDDKLVAKAIKAAALQKGPKRIAGTFRAVMQGKVGA